MQPWMEYCCHVWTDAPSCYLWILYKPQKHVCKVVGLSLTVCLEPLVHRQNVSSLSIFYRCYCCRCSSELAKLVPIPYPHERSTCYFDRLHDFSFTISISYKDVYLNSFFPHSVWLWSSLPIEYSPLTSLNSFKFRTNSDLLPVCSF